MDLALFFAFGCFGIGLALTMARVLWSPTTADRILAADTMVVNVIALIVLYGIRSGSVLSLDVATLFAMTGFISTVAFCKYLLRGNIIE